MKVYGGFAGTETAASQSNPATNVTIIDGGGTTQCITGADLAASTVVRGFTIRNGKDNSNDGGGGMVLENSSAIMVQCIFENNKASMFGGAVAVRGTGSPQFINSIFRNNGESSGDNPEGGGALFAYSGYPAFVNCLFHGNKAGEGGVALVYLANPVFVNCTFVGNEATIGYGGAVHDPSGQTTFRNCIVWDNTTTRGVGWADQISTGWSGVSLVTHSDVEGGSGGTGNINTDPVFVNPGANDYRLNPYTSNLSPCIDVGSVSFLPADVGDLDWDNNQTEQTPRDLDGNLRTKFGFVDMGAYEVTAIVDD